MLLKTKIEEAFEFFTKEEVQVRTEGEVIIFTEGIEEVTTVGQLRLITNDNFFHFQNKSDDSLPLLQNSTMATSTIHPN